MGEKVSEPRQSIQNPFSVSACMSWTRGRENCARRASCAPASRASRSTFSSTFSAHADDVVSRDQLRVLLWPKDTYVDYDHSLNTAVEQAARSSERFGR